MAKKKIGIVAKKLDHSLSPFIHNYWSKKNKEKYIYKKYEIKEENISKFFQKYKCDKDFIGFNITIPYKERFINLCDRISLRAKKIGSINLIFKKNKIVYGDNTDVIGFGKTFNSLKVKKVKGVLLIGAGGAARAILYYLNNKKIENIDIFATSYKRKDSLSKNFKFKILTNRPSQLKNSYDLIINASSAGMNVNNQINKSVLKIVRNAKYLIDIVYNPIETDLLREANKHNIKSSGGLKMLIEQAKPSYESWIGKKIKIDKDIHKILLKKICTK